MKKFDLGKWLWISLASTFFGVFIKLTTELQENDHGFYLLDRSILLLAQNLRRQVLNGPAVDLTALGSPTICTILSVSLIFAFVLKRDKASAKHLLIASTGSAFWTFVLKNYFHRPRPSEIVPLVEGVGFSYPSGHSLASTAIFITIAFLMGRDCNRKRQTALIVFAMILSGLVAISRIYLGVHYPSDALSGFLFGAAWAFFLVWYFFKKRDEKDN